MRTNHYYLLNTHLLKRWFDDANYKVCNPPHLPPAISEPTTLAEDDNNTNIYLKLGSFHPHYIPSRTCQQIYEEELSTVLEEEIGIKRMVVCTKRATNIGDVVSRTSLYQNRGEEVSTFIRGGHLTR